MKIIEIKRETPPIRSYLMTFYMTLHMTQMLSCGDPLVNGTYRGEPLGELKVLIQPYQQLESYNTDGVEAWVSVEQYCLEESSSCLTFTDSLGCQIERNQCTQETRAGISWMQRPANVSFAVLWLPISLTRGETPVIDYLEERNSLPQSLPQSQLIRTQPDRPFPHQGSLTLYQPPPTAPLVPINLTQYTQFKGLPELDESAGVLGVPIAYIDRDQDPRYSAGDTLIGLTLDQGVMYAQLPAPLSAEARAQLRVNPSAKALKSALLSRVNFPFCSPPRQWILSDQVTTPLTLTLMELNSWTLEEELERYLYCEAGVSPRCELQSDLTETCTPSEGESELCLQCLDQLVDQRCRQLMSHCVERVEDTSFIEDEPTGDSGERLDYTLCNRMLDACWLRTDCAQLSLYCQGEEEYELDWGCTRAETALCYQESSCIIQTITDEDLGAEITTSDLFDLYDWVSAEHNQTYQGCLDDARYQAWVETHPECTHDLDAVSLEPTEAPRLESPEADFTGACSLMECERAYITCMGDHCEALYFECILLRLER